MGIARSIAFGIIGLLASSFVGVIIWYILGTPYDNYSPVVVISCNIVPVIGMLAGVYVGWKSASE